MNSIDQAKDMLHQAQCHIQQIHIARHLDAITIVTMQNFHFWAYLSCLQLVWYENLKALLYIRRYAYQ